MTRARAVAVLALALVVVYVCGAFVDPLRRADDQAKQFSSAHQLNDRIRHHGLPLIENIVFGLVMLAVVALAVTLVVLALRRGRIDEQLVRAAAVPVVALGLAEIGKVVLPRPSQAYEPWWLAGQTFPSGHAATGIACLLALFALARRRAELAPLLAAGVSVFAIGVVLSGQHRPTDAIGALLLALLALWAVGPLDADHTTRPTSTRARADIRTAGAVTMIVGIVFAWVAAVVAPRSSALDHINDGDGSFALLATSILLLAVAAALAASDHSTLRQRPT